MIHAIHLAGAFAVNDILAYNQSRTGGSVFARFFPLWKLCPGSELRAAGETPASRQATLLVVNLTPMVWDQIKDDLPAYGRTVLVQTEARIDYEPAYDHCDKFDRFVNFDRTYASHPGFLHAYAPYAPRQPHSRRDLRGLDALKDQWRYSRSVFLDTTLFRFFPRHRKASLIITLHPREHYQIRLRLARKWLNEVDVFGGAWPKDLTSWRGRCGDKLEVARRYRYALVMENQRQPGYVTEKLLDAFASGAVPLYWGAPDVGELPGAEAIIPFENEDFDLRSAMQNGREYARRKRIIQASRERLFDLFSPQRFGQLLAQAVNE
jgi:hypothetical protein